MDPAVDGAAAQNAASAASLNSPVNANGLSVADIVAAQGSVPFTPQSAAGAVGVEVPAGGAGAGTGAGAGAGDGAAGGDTGNAGGDNADTGADNGADTGADTTVPTSNDLQTFTGAVGAAADPITFSGNPDRPFDVAGSTFVNFGAAAARTCDRQFNACANAANGGQGVAFADCNTQKSACTAAQAATSVTSFDAAAAAPAAGNASNAGSDTGACTNSRLRRREVLKKRQEKSKRQALLNSILKKRAELAILEAQYL